MKKTSIIFVIPLSHWWSIHTCLCVGRQTNFIEAFTHILFVFIVDASLSCSLLIPFHLFFFSLSLFFFVYSYFIRPPVMIYKKTRSERVIIPVVYSHRFGKIEKKTFSDAITGYQERFDTWFGVSVDRWKLFENRFSSFISSSCTLTVRCASLGSTKILGRCTDSANARKKLLFIRQTLSLIFSWCVLTTVLLVPRYANRMWAMYSSQ